MIYPDTAVRTAIYSLLTNANISAFDSEVPEGVVSPYVLLENQTNTNYSTKSTFGFIHQITLKAVAVGPAASGKEEAETLLNQALSVLTNDKPGEPIKIVLWSPFRCWKLKAGPAKDLVFTGDTESVYQKFVTLELTIESIP